MSSATATKTAKTPYQLRLGLVVHALEQKKLKLDADATTALATQILHDLDHVPERIR